MTPSPASTSAPTPACSAAASCCSWRAPRRRWRAGAEEGAVAAGVRARARGFAARAGLGRARRGWEVIAAAAVAGEAVDFLWPRIEQLPDTLVFEGVEVTGYQIFEDPKVQKAIVFASTAHIGQFRRTGDPYVTHCIHTGKILAALVPSTGERAINTVVAGILHDVIDDTTENLKSVAEQFGDDVASLVSGVSKLSYINQASANTGGSTLTSEEANNPCAMLLGMVDDPRGGAYQAGRPPAQYANNLCFPIPKAEAVAQETLAVWCSLASRLGVWALKAELEDLFFKKIRSELTSMWNSTSKDKSMRRSSIRSDLLALHGSDLLQAVLPFDLFLDRRRRSDFLNNLQSSSEASIRKPKIVDDAAIALTSLAACEEELQQELLITTSRLKSLYSIYCKALDKYDARMLRVIVGDKNGALHGPAVRSCYNILDIVHRLWTPIDGEFDDYIINPKGSGYQSLHTAVQASDSSPLEVQIRTQRMHEYAEYGLAAHWLYKESNVNTGSGMGNKIKQSTLYASSSSEDEITDGVPSKYISMKVGHPVLRIDGNHLLAAVIVSIEKGGKELLVAVRFTLEASEDVAERRSSFQLKRWEAYARLHKKVTEKWWCAPGHGDWSTNLEKYILCRDGIYHKQDQFGRLLPTFIQIIDLTEEEEEEYWMVVSAVFEGKETSTLTSESSNGDRSTSDLPISTPLSDPINNKVHLLRTMLQWEEQVRRRASVAERSLGAKSLTDPILREVAIICWPYGKIMRMSTGSNSG
ncbi:hypothetical protein ZWY2020_028746 [Hordeum vulgare]|nr:hypothetical protein ZWY2020_028746 [Hordeum vulgare]